MFGTAALNALYECAIHVIAKHYITATPWAALVQNHIGSLFWVENKRPLEKISAGPLSLHSWCVAPVLFAPGDEQ
jgi:hypothetical protein